MTTVNTLIKEPKLIDFDDVTESLTEHAQLLIAASLSTSPQAVHPTLVHLCGIPGSGKSTYALDYRLHKPNFVLVQFDAVMESLPSYQQDLLNFGPTVAFQHWEIPARAIGYHLLQALLENRRCVLFDHSAANQSHTLLIDKVKNWGYRVEMHYLACSSQLAVERIHRRQELTNRHTPESLVHDRQRLLVDLVALYRQQVDSFLTIAEPPAISGQQSTAISLAN
jgi:predicted ABC-type ATPase